MVGRQVRGVFTGVLRNHDPAFALAAEVVGEGHGAFTLFGSEDYFGDGGVAFHLYVLYLELHPVQGQAGAAFQITPDGLLGGGLEVGTLGGFRDGSLRLASHQAEGEKQKKREKLFPSIHHTAKVA